MFWWGLGGDSGPEGSLVWKRLDRFGGKRSDFSEEHDLAVAGQVMGRFGGVVLGVEAGGERGLEGFGNLDCGDFGLKVDRGVQKKDTFFLL